MRSITASFELCLMRPRAWAHQTGKYDQKFWFNEMAGMMSVAFAQWALGGWTNTDCDARYRLRILFYLGFVSSISSKGCM